MKNLEKLMREQGILRYEITDSVQSPPIPINNAIWDATAEPVNLMRDLYFLAWIGLHIKYDG